MGLVVGLANAVLIRRWVRAAGGSAADLQDWPGAGRPADRAQPRPGFGAAISGAYSAQTNGIVVKAKQTWPREKKIYCHRAEEWPAEPEIVERLPVRTCVRRGPAIDLVLNRARENRSQFVIANARGREMIFWQSPRTGQQARPAVRIPTARAHGQILDIVIDTAEKYPYTFSSQQTSTTRQQLPAGDYAIRFGDEVVAAVERKTLEDLAASLLSGKLTYALAELTALPRAAVVVEDRYSRLFKLEHAPGARVAEALAEAQARFPAVPIVFCDPATRPGMDLPLVGRVSERTDSSQRSHRHRIELCCRRADRTGADTISAGI